LTGHEARWPGTYRLAAGTLRTVPTLKLKWGASWPKVLPASMTRFPSGDDLIPATVLGTRSKLLGTLELLLYCVGVTFICCAHANVMAATARPSAWCDVKAAVAVARARKLKAWPMCLVWTTELRNYRRALHWHECGIELLLRAPMCWLSSPSLTSWRDVLTAEARPPSSKLR
jgi:hypothetical protein